MRFESYGWDVRRVDWRHERRTPYVEDIDALAAAIKAGRAVTDKPTIIVLDTIIAWPAPTLQDTGKSHGAALGAGRGQGHQEAARLRPGGHVRGRRRGDRAHARRASASAAAPRTRRGKKGTTPGAAAQPRPGRPPRPAPGARGCPTASRRPSRRSTPTPRRAWRRERPPARSSPPWPMSCRSCGADPPTSPTPTTRRWTARPSFVPTEHQTAMWPGNPYGRTLHFGIRENAMGMILNGIALEGLTRPYGGTFLIFSDYMRPAVRLAALQRVPVVFVWTHDSVGLGEDGPTHQPIEQIPSLRAHSRTCRWCGRRTPTRPRSPGARY